MPNEIINRQLPPNEATLSANNCPRGQRITAFIFQFVGKEGIAVERIHHRLLEAREVQDLMLQKLGDILFPE